MPPKIVLDLNAIHFFQCLKNMKEEYFKHEEGSASWLRALGVRDKVGSWERGEGGGVRGPS